MVFKLTCRRDIFIILYLLIEKSQYKRMQQFQSYYLNWALQHGWNHLLTDFWSETSYKLKVEKRKILPVDHETHK